jgi:hypothetical protein
MSDARKMADDMLELAAKGLLSSCEPDKRFKKMMAVNKIKSQPFFGKADYGTVTFRRPVPYKMVDVIETGEYRRKTLYQTKQEKLF